MSQVYPSNEKPQTDAACKSGGKKGSSSDKLKAERVELMLASLPGWKLSFDKLGLTRSFQFASVERAFAFANLVAGMALRRNLYPEVRLQRDVVTLQLSSAKSGGLTVLDFALARQINQHV